MQQPALFSRIQAAKYLNLGISSVRRLVSIGELREIRIGKRALIAVAELDRYIAAQQAIADAAAVDLESKLAS